jgi:glycosyltransferase involved in cell wall biosynthesis
MELNMLVTTVVLLMPVFLSSSQDARVVKSNRYTILFTTDSFYPPKGGGDISLRTLMTGLTERGHQIAVAYFGEDEDPSFQSHVLTYPPLLRGFWPRHLLVRKRLKNRLADVIRDTKPDVVITQQIATSATVDVCSESGIPVIVMLRGVDFLCLGSFSSGKDRPCDRKCLGCEDVGDRMAQFPFFRTEINRIERSLHNADALVANSNYTRKVFKDLVGVDSIVLTPPLVEPAKDARIREDGAVLFVTPMSHKGVDIAIEVARNLPRERFLFVGSAKNSTRRVMAEISNITYIPWVENMSECYEKTKVVIVPSVIPEGYGRVCSEAISRGIPCIVSPVGALPETVGPAGDVVMRYRDPKQWLEAVGKYSDKEYARMKSGIAVQNAGRFPGRDSYATSVEAIIDGVVSRHQMGVDSRAT